jgi:hypothetical protein
MTTRDITLGIVLFVALLLVLIAATYLPEHPWDGLVLR